MAVVSDRRMVYEEKVQALQAKVSGGMETDDVQSEIGKLKILIQEEENKIQRYKIENVRRRHNYLPFIIELLKILAQQGKLVDLVEKAKEKTAQKKTEKEVKKEIKEEVK